MTRRMTLLLQAQLRAEQRASESTLDHTRQIFTHRNDLSIQYCWPHCPLAERAVLSVSKHFSRLQGRMYGIQIAWHFAAHSLRENDHNSCERVSVVLEFFKSISIMPVSSAPRCTHIGGRWEKKISGFAGCVQPFAGCVAFCDKCRGFQSGFVPNSVSSQLLHVLFPEHELPANIVSLLPLTFKRYCVTSFGGRFHACMIGRPRKLNAHTTGRFTNICTHENECWLETLLVEGLARLVQGWVRK
jgi:hypothetical protein